MSSAHTCRIRSYGPLGRLVLTVGLTEAGRLLGVRPPLLRRYVLCREPAPAGLDVVAVQELQRLWEGREVPAEVKGAHVDGGPPR